MKKLNAEVINENIFLISISKVVCANSNNILIISSLSLVNGLHFPLLAILTVTPTDMWPVNWSVT